MESEKSALLDTCITLDKTLKRQPFNNEASRIFSLAKQGFFTAYISASSITDIFYTLRKSLKSKKLAMQEIEHILAVVRIAALDDADIRRAASLHWPDFEDAVQFTAAESAHADYLITRNAKDYKQAPGEKIITPGDFVALFTE
jgi:predicted nucleic acid-binding protein